jgi:hypothetical protein
MLIYVLRWWPSWISNRHKNRNLVKDIPMIIHLKFGYSQFISLKKRGKVKVFCSDIKWKMAATAGLSLTLDPMEKLKCFS